MEDTCMANYSIFGEFSPAIRERFYTALSDYPRCTDSLLAGHRKCPKDVAIKRRYLELNRENYWCKYLTFDCDSPGAALAWSDLNLPAPTFCVMTRQNGHAHLTYELKTPVHLGGDYSQKATYYLLVIKQGYTKALEADDTYGGLLSKNPLSSFWEVFGCDVTYDLDELAEPLREISFAELEKVPLSELEAAIKSARIPMEEKRQPKPVETDPQGSLFVFHNTRYFAYETVYDVVVGKGRFAELYGKVENYIVQLAADFNLRLTPGRIRSDAQSIAKWVWERRSSFVAAREQFSEVQRQRAYLSHESRRRTSEAEIRKAISQFLLEGMRISKAAIAREAGISREAVSRYYSHLF